MSVQDAPVPKITFVGEDGEEVGALYLGDPMRFKGNVEESARIFFERLIEYAYEQNRIR